MSKMPNGDGVEKPASKNIKNIYVHKINSLIKISRDSLAVEEVQMLSQNKMGKKKIKKVYSQTDKTVLKLEKNRESARKARQRKNLYIKLLQSQVFALRKQLAESQIIENSSTKYLSLIKNASKQATIHRQNSSVQEQLDRYLSQDNLANLDERKQRNEKKIERIGEVVDQLRFWFVPQIFKGIKNLKKQQRNQLNNKIFKNTVFQFEKQLKTCKNKNEHTLRLLLPFEQHNPQLKVTNMMKSLNKNMEQIQQYLHKLPEICKRLQQLIKNQNSNDLNLTEVAKIRIKQLVHQMGICGVGDKPQKFLERSLRWEEFPSANITMTMEKIIQFDRFIASDIQTSEQVKEEKVEQSQIEQQREDSNMED